MQSFQILFAVGLILAGCGATTDLFTKKVKPKAVVVVSVPTDDSLRPKPRPDRADLEAMKTVTKEEIAQAMVVPTGAVNNLGTTIISLGLLDRDGLWLRTPLVKAEGPGRVVYSKSGKSANVTLLPLKGDKGAGSQLSLAAMQILGIPFTGLVEVQVFAR